MCQKGKCCRPPGGRCTRHGHCCSGRCNKNKRECKPCPADQEPCGGACVAAGACDACPLGPTLCDDIICGRTRAGKPCGCTTTYGETTTCTSNYYCIDCETDADCEDALGLPGGAACTLLWEGCTSCSMSGERNACVVKGCVDVEFCEGNEDCAAGTCVNHRCQ